MREALARSGLALATASFYGVLFNRENGLSNSLGYNLQAAERILLGEVPYRDFHTLYPPATIYLNAAVFRGLGVGLFTALLLVLVFKALTVFVLYLSARQLMPRVWSLGAAGAGLFWLRPNGPFKAVPMHYGAFFLALAVYLLLRGLYGGKPGALWWAGASLSALSLCKHNIGFYALAGTLLVVWARDGREAGSLNSKGKREAGLRILVGFGVPLAIVAALLQRAGAFIPMARTLLFGPGEFLVGRFGSIPSPVIPLLVVAGLAVALWSLGKARSKSPLADGLAVVAIGFPALLVAFGDTASIDPMLFWLPAVVMGFCLIQLWAGRASWRGWRVGTEGGEILLIGAAASYLEAFPRFAREQVVAAMPFVTVLLFWLIHQQVREGRERFGATRRTWIALAALPALSLTMASRLFLETFFDSHLNFRSTTSLTTPRGKGVLFSPAQAAEIDRVVDYLDGRVAPDGYFFAHSREASSFLFLTGRRNPSPVQFWDGVGVGEEDRAATLRTIDRKKVGLIVTSNQNLRAEQYPPLIDYIDRNFQPDRRFGDILVLRRK